MNRREKCGNSIFFKLVVFCFFSLLLVTDVRAQSDDRSLQVDKIFSLWDKPNTPGCAVAVFKDRKIIYQRGYGIADLEHDISITPSTVFYVGSVSKQFTAFAIALLVDQGKLSLDDNVRKFLPEVPDYGTPITVRHLIHHTSGLRDYNVLLSLAGRRNDEAFDNQTILEITTRQKELNFIPGEQYLYSNTGYALLALIVERVSKMKFSHFADTHIFKPLGMTETHFHEDLTQIVKHRAVGYSPKPDGGFRLDTPYNERAGAGGLYTTVGDLLKWDTNFYDARVGGLDFIKRLHTKGKLNSGQTLDYAFALNVREYKGLTMVEHGGALGGYRAALTRFPEQNFSIACLCNLGTINPDRLVNQITDIYLANLVNPAATRINPAIKGGAEGISIPGVEERMKEKVGAYFDQNAGELLQLSLREGKLIAEVLGTQISLTPISASRYRSVSSAIPAEIEFQKLAAQKNWSLRLFLEGQQPSTFHAVSLAIPSLNQLSEYAGDYFSNELNVTYTLYVDGNKLFYKYSRAQGMALKPTIQDGFSAAGSIRFHFSRDSQNRIVGFTVNAGRVRNLRFDKKSN